MIGRGAIGRPMIFHEIKSALGWEKPATPWDCEDDFGIRLWCWNRYVELARKTTGLQAKWLNRHAVSFTKGLPGGKNARKEISRDRDPEAVAKGIEKWLQEKAT